METCNRHEISVTWQRHTFRVKISVLWIITTCSLVHRKQPFGGSSCFRPNACTFLKNFMVLHPRRLQSSYSQPTELQTPHRLFQNKLLRKKYRPKRQTLLGEQTELYQQLYILYWAPYIIFTFTTAWRNNNNNAPIWTINAWREVRYVRENWNHKSTMIKLKRQDNTNISQLNVFDSRAQKSASVDVCRLTLKFPKIK